MEGAHSLPLVAISFHPTAAKPSKKGKPGKGGTVPTSPDVAAPTAQRQV